MKPETKNEQASTMPELSLEEQLNKANETISSMLTVDAAVNLVPAMFGDTLLGALTRKYAQKYSKFPAEQASHREMFPAFAGNTGMLYILVSAKQEADERIASETRAVNVANLTGMVNSYVQSEVLTEFQVTKNAQTDAEIAGLKDKVGDNQSERTAILKAVRKTWITSIDHTYSKAQDNKLRRACHIFGTTLEALA